ncbi:MAG: response regulator [Magnetococcales bacterium]|nr:response regulator [Magnetococcales bacterium]
MIEADASLRKRLLIVDDTLENIDLLKEILAPHYRLQVATSGRLAIRVALSSTPPDLILLDIMMPDMDGYETCQILKQDPRTRDIPVLFVTAKSQVADEIRGFELGAADYLIKPVSAPKVLARVRTHLALNDQRRLLADEVTRRTAQLEQRNRELEETRIEVIRQLGRASDYRDNETGMHVMRVAGFTRLLALKAGLCEAEAEAMQLAAPLHDVGKIGIPDEILLKNGKLTPEEFEVIKRHPEMGFKIIGDQKSDILHLGAEVALTHHEKWNGSGYPRGLTGEGIPVCGRIVALADVYDALTSIRPYKRSWSVDDALNLIRAEAGGHFDPYLAGLFLEMRPEVEQVMRCYQDG